MLVPLDSFNQILHVDKELLQVTVGAGITLSKLNVELANLGLALPNLGDIDSQTLAGAISTGTHGTGSRYSSISAAVIGLRIVTGDGSIISTSKFQDPEILESARVSLGAFGVVTSITLQCVEAFFLEGVELTTALDAVLERFDDEDTKSDFVEFYWYPHTEIAELKINNRTLNPVSKKGGIVRFLKDRKSVV